MRATVIIIAAAVSTPVLVNADHTPYYSGLSSQEVKASLVLSTWTFALDNSCEEQDFSSAPLLATVLQHATFLSYLDIGPSDELFLAEPAVASAVASLSHLSDISLGEAGSHTLQCLSQLCSHPRCLSINFKSGYEQIPDDVELLGKIPTSMEKFSLQTWFHQSIRLCETYVCPTVHSLTLESPIPLPDAFHAFPNVETLHVALKEKGDAFLWESVDHLEVLFIYGASVAPSLSVRVRRVTCHLLSLKLLSFLHSTAPVVLTCDLQYLELRTDCHVHSTFNDSQLWLLASVINLRAVPLLGLGLFLNVAYGRSPSIASQKSMFASTLAAQLPHLVYVGISTTKCKYRRLVRGRQEEEEIPLTWFCITRSDGDIQALELSPYEGNKVHHALQNTLRQ
ncbi:uncharacterized protein FIBRA_07555 [Fibroporia radiculosa]|uniref:Uncharacterized protein n=1 Tax=Fibroporia radiculosa TaxID=599839 RepID=J4IBV9_9APHY|nr:uncharacterized protein FIBRA_07555 [Fibroporia radiculosa]CCM05341.1 predicted protein [Fibroporia radiculosa]